jgi:hypothetical protein
MHRAVLARLADPNLSLFESLKLGGFGYSEDDDAKCIDHENVTLGQRKNQLSRRLRKAKNNPNASIDPIKKVEEQVKKKFTTKKRPAEDLLEQELRNTSRPEPDTDAHDETDNPRLLAKFHPDFYPMLVPPQATARLQQPQGRATDTAVANSYGGGNYSQYLMQQQHQQHDSTRMYAPSAPPIPQRATSGLDSAISGHTTFGSTHSGVAVAALANTANSVGMTLEQLALALSTSSNLVQILTKDNSHDSRKQQELACNLYQNDVRSLRQRSMLLAGYSMDQTLEESQAHVEISMLAWQLEGRRLQDLFARKGAFDMVHAIDKIANDVTLQFEKQRVLDTNNNNNMIQDERSRTNNNNLHQQPDARARPHSHDTGHSHDNHEQHAPSRMTIHDNPAIMNPTGNPRINNLHHQHHQHVDACTRSLLQETGHSDDNEGHSHDHRQPVPSRLNVNNPAAATLPTLNTHDDCAFYNGRHIHRLEGKCGHKAILHQPTNGSAHIDFVVGNKVECYQEVQPLATNNTTCTIWPSQYKCQDLSCEKKCSNQITNGHTHTNDCAASANPRILNLGDLDMQGNEWNSEFMSQGQVDEGLLGLFKLGGDSSKSLGDRSDSVSTDVQ